MSEQPISILEKYWHYTSFRHPQEEIIDAVLHKKDVLALMPTGGGKSLCYQIPALCMDGLCLVVTPLIALMLDQVENLKARNIRAAAIHSGMAFSEVKKNLQNVIYGNYKLLYVSPERLSSQLFREFLPDLHVQLIAVDEAHCISQWGYDFRPAYLEIGTLREFLPGVNMIALTASATPQVLDDIAEKLLLKNVDKFYATFERPNLSYSVFLVESKINKLLEILKNVPGSSIVYCKTRKTAHRVSALLQENNIVAGFYHAGLSQAIRDEKQAAWKSGNLRVMCSTNAFGMGIDKSNVRTVIHFDVADALESFYQEAGRAGRDGKKAYSVILYNYKDLENLSQLHEIKYPPIAVIKKIYQSIVDFLAIPVNSGGGAYFSFNINDFCAVFKHGVIETINVLKALEQEGHLSFNANIFIPAHAIFHASKKWITDFEKQFPNLEPVIKSMLRTYDGIFDNKVPINELQISRLLKINETEIKSMLFELHANGIIEYFPAKDTPQIYFTWDRASAAHLNIDLKRYAQQKENYKKRTDKMRAFLLLKNSCRSKFIAAYFGDDTAKNCGICDICYNNNNDAFTEKNLNAIKEKILNHIPEKGIPLNQLKVFFPVKLQKKYWQIFEFMQSEEMLQVSDKGIVSRKK